MGIQLDGINNEIKSQTKIDFPGSVGVAGTLTYEDVTNVDSIGIVTARTGVIVGSGVTLNATGVIATGIITATSFSGSGANLTGITGTTINNNANNRLITGSGTANTLEGEANLTFDGSQLVVKGADTATGSGAAKAMSLRQGDANGEFVNLAFETGAGGPIAVISGIADATGVYPNTTGSLSFNTQVGGSVFERLRIQSDGEVFIGDAFGGGNRSTQVSIVGADQSPTGVWAQVGVYSNDSQAADKGGSLSFGGQDGSTPRQTFAAIKGAKENSSSGNYAGHMTFYTRPAGAVSLERLRIDSSGRLLINTPYPQSHGTVNNGSINASYEYQGARSSSRDNTGARGHLVFYNPNGHVGGVNTNGSSTSFNTSSDYRLKENVVAISDGITRLKTLKPSRFNFKKDADVTVDGFLAHEVTAVPESITGIKDEVVTQTLVDSGEKDESELGDPIYQQIDQAKLVPLLTAALQEAITKIETLETKVTALEGS